LGVEDILEMEAHKVPSPFVRYRCSQCHRWVREDALSCRCGAIFYHTIHRPLRDVIEELRA